MSESVQSRNSLDDISRPAWMGELARADARELCDRMATFLGGRSTPEWRWMRRPEIGLVMSRGRISGEGDPFNLGETTVTRCALRLESGEEGFAYVLGRAPRKAEMAALADALMQTEAAAALRETVLDPLAASRAAREAKARAEAEGTRVEFFTLVRGEDE